VNTLNADERRGENPRWEEARDWEIATPMLRETFIVFLPHTIVSNPCFFCVMHFSKNCSYPNLIAQKKIMKQTNATTNIYNPLLIHE